MEMERISEDVIKVQVSIADLRARGVNILELIDDQREVERFVDLIVEEGGLDRQFFESGALTFQFMPSGHGELEIFISRGSGQFQVEHFIEKEIIDRLINQDRSSKDQEAGVLDADLSRDFADFFEAMEAKEVTESSNQEVLDPAHLDPSTIVVTFADLEDLLNFTREVKDVPVEADLYQVEDAYVLMTHDLLEVLGDDQASYYVLRAMEYGDWTKTLPLVIREHGHLLRQGDTLKYFGYNL